MLMIWQFVPLADLGATAVYLRLRGGDGRGCGLAALNVKYRDFPPYRLFTQFGLYISPSVAVLVPKKGVYHRLN